ncbi:MAG: membrane protein insertase YidC [Ruminococcus sp.]|nr:membrane protein insertase YidC [Ruminococcus sp.]
MNAIYDVIGYPFGLLMKLIFGIFNNYAVSIIVFTVVTKLLLLPVNYKTQKNAARMQLLTPKLDKLRKSYSNNPQRLQQEQQKLYVEEGINPMGSCLPAFIQMFLLFGILDVVYKPIRHILGFSKGVRREAAEIAGTSFKNLRCELKVMDAVKADPGSFIHLKGGEFVDKVRDFSENFTIFGANLGKTPSVHVDWTSRESVILFFIPILAGLAQLISSVYSQIHQKKTNPNMQGGGCLIFMMYFMPLLSVWFAFQVPAGVGFYWIWSALLSFIITFCLNQYFTPERTVAINEKEKEKARIYAEKHPEKKTFMQRMLEQQELANQQQNAAKNRKNNDKISRSELKKADRDRINEARRRMAEKYGDIYDESANDNDNDED